MYSNIKNWIKKNRKEVVLICAIIIACLVYSSFYLSLPPKFNSPDETSNYFFAKLYAEKGTLRVFEPLNFFVENRLHPRSMAVVNGYLVPGGFLGLILIYGWLAKILGIRIILVLTPLFAGLAVFCFYEIIKKIFNLQIAFWSSLLLLIHPVFWYYSSRGLYPNILFVSLLIIGFYFLICRSKFTQNYACFILAGFFFGLALTVRLSEIIWVSGMLFLLFLIYREKIRWNQAVLFFVFVFLTFSPILIYNQIFYGSPFLTAYNLNDRQIGESNEDMGWFLSFYKYIFPFGLHFKNILKNFSNYFVGMFWWLAIPFTIGVSIFVHKLINGKLNKEQRIFLFFCFFVFLFLFAYYGSWHFYDNPAKQISIGTSYGRYWLPIHVLSLPYIAFALIKFVKWFSGVRRKILGILFCIIYFLFSFNLTFFDLSDGLLKVREDIKKYTVIVSEINQIIEPGAIIIVDQADKIFFPEYKVIQPLRDEITYKLIPKLAKLVPLYYYGITLPEKDIDYLYAKKLDRRVVEIKKIGDFGAESLYRLESRIVNPEIMGKLK